MTNDVLFTSRVFFFYSLVNQHKHNENTRDSNDDNNNNNNNNNRNNKQSSSKPTHESVYQYIVQTGIVGKTTNNLVHVDTTTTKHAIIDAIVSAKSTDDAL